jgi:hypothetical protein
VYERQRFEEGVQELAGRYVQTGAARTFNVHCSTRLKLFPCVVVHARHILSSVFIALSEW